MPQKQAGHHGDGVMLWCISEGGGGGGCQSVSVANLYKSDESVKCASYIYEEHHVCVCVCLCVCVSPLRGPLVCWPDH